MATAVSTPSPPAPSHTQRPTIASAEPPSSTTMAAAAQSQAGWRPKCACSATAAGKSTSFWIPPIRKAETNAALEIGRSHGNERMAAIQRGVSVFGLISHRPAGAAERTPKALEIRNGKPAGPGAGMIMAVHAAGVGAPAHLHGVGSHGLCLAVRPDPIAVAAE